MDVLPSVLLERSVRSMIGITLVRQRWSAVIDVCPRSRDRSFVAYSLRQEGGI